MDKKTIYYSVGAVVLLIVAYLIFGRSSASDVKELYSKVQTGPFEVIVTTTGELKSENSQDIEGPAGLGNRDLRIREIKIQDLIPEGTVVDSGAYVATLDRAEVMVKLKDIEDELEKVQSQYVKTQLDTTIKLREYRDDIIVKTYALEEADIKLEQSRFEPPATIRQVKIDLDKATRSLSQAKKNYLLKVKQANADMREVEINLDKQKRQKETMMALIKEFRIYAPKKGMVIYHKEWSGQKRKVGSSINPWDLTVATLPDLSKMISKTYVNEIDISKVKKGMIVNIGVDAFPDKAYIGVITEVANIGEQMANSDSKVFEIIIKLDGSDSILRPAMTTSNSIIISQSEEVNYLPIEAVRRTDTLDFVYTKSGKRKVILCGVSNENNIVITKGLDAGETVMLSEPENPDKFPFEGLELLNDTANSLVKKEDNKSNSSRKGTVANR